MEKIPLPTIKRLPAYLQILREQEDAGAEWTSTTTLASALRLKAIQVRKDMGYADCAGKPKLGFNTKDSITRLETVLGLKNLSETILIGVGSLGAALLKYKGFERYEMSISAAFDLDPELIGTMVGNIVIRDIQRVKEYIIRTNTQFAIIAVPRKAAQEVADIVINAGISGIWNFSSSYLKTPEHVIVKREDLALSLARLQAEVMHSRQ